MNSEAQRISRSRRNTECGFVLLGLLLMMALLLIAIAAAVPKIAQQIRRDREEELIHRAMQYRRAIRTFAKRTGRFPLRLEELEDTDGTRYLRKRYKDPITGGEFRLLHPEDVQATGARLASSSPPDQSSNGSSDQAGLNQSGSSQATATLASNNEASATASTPVGNGTGGLGGLSASSGMFATSNFGSSTAPGGSVANSNSSLSGGGPQPGEPIVHGGLILGVASSSKAKTIREFEHKAHYNQWLFFYSAIYDGSFEVKGPTPTNPIFPAIKNSPDSPQSTAQAGQPSP